MYNQVEYAVCTIEENECEYGFVRLSKIIRGFTEKNCAFTAIPCLEDN